MHISLAVLLLLTLGGLAFGSYYWSPAGGPYRWGVGAYFLILFILTLVSVVQVG